MGSLRRRYLRLSLFVVLVAKVGSTSTDKVVRRAVISVDGHVDSLHSDGTIGNTANDKATHQAYQTVSASRDVEKMQKRSQVGHQDNIDTFTKTHGNNYGSTGMVEGALQRKGSSDRRRQQSGTDEGGSCTPYECLHVCSTIKNWVESGSCEVPNSDARRRNRHSAPPKATACGYSFSKLMIESAPCMVNGWWPSAVQPCFEEGSRAAREFAEYCASSLMEDNKSENKMVQRARSNGGSSVNGTEREWSEKQKKSASEALDDSLNGKCN